MTQITTGTCKLIRTCDHLTMEAFIACLVDGKLELLILEGSPAPGELETVWADIYAEYSELMGDEAHNDTLKLLRDISILNLQYKRITILIQMLTVCHVPNAVAELKRLGYTVRWDPENLPRYLRDLESAYNRSKSLLSRIEVMQHDLTEKQGKQKGEVSTYGDFQTMLISLSEYVKYQVIPSQITAYQFAVMTKRMRQYSQKLESRMNRQKGGGRWQKN